MKQNCPREMTSEAMTRFFGELGLGISKQDLRDADSVCSGVARTLLATCVPANVLSEYIFQSKIKSGISGIIFRGKRATKTSETDFAMKIIPVHGYRHDGDRSGKRKWKLGIPGEETMESTNEYAVRREFKNHTVISEELRKPANKHHAFKIPMVHGKLGWHVSKHRVRKFAVYMMDFVKGESNVSQFKYSIIPEILDCIHAMGFVHGDLHSANLSVMNGETSVFDFGRTIDLYESPMKNNRYNRIVARLLDFVSPAGSILMEPGNRFHRADFAVYMRAMQPALAKLDDEIVCLESSGNRVLTAFGRDFRELFLPQKTISRAEWKHKDELTMGLMMAKAYKVRGHSLCHFDMVEGGF